ncbi:hypothetical protein V6N13_020849 [Hibiscus sabdariffa]|uniref:WRKY domain-containing protein n=1 Tax=Hibiscus sabdariffa TaxID=183260 RepID=A0ABR2EUS3_9ROSI
MDVDWDLHAVVRGYAAVETTSTGGSATGYFKSDLCPQFCFSSFGGQEETFQGHALSSSNEIQARSSWEDLHELYKSFFPKSQPLSPQSAPLSSFSSVGLSKEQQPQPKQSHACSVTSVITSVSNNSANANSHNSRSKRRNNQLKKVCLVPAEGLSSDMWAWRKYGQKPIKGSPYPRGYYRCSTSKVCLARKQVGRSRSDQSMFIVTYTGKHNHPAPMHRSSLAGSTRQKPLNAEAVTADDSIKVSSAKSVSSLSLTASMEEELVVQSNTKVEIREDLVEDDFGLSDTTVSDDFFEGLDELAEMITGNCFSDHLEPSVDLATGGI